MFVKETPEERSDDSLSVHTKGTQKRSDNLRLCGKYTQWIHDNMLRVNESDLQQERSNYMLCVSDIELQQERSNISLSIYDTETLEERNEIRLCIESQQEQSECQNNDILCSHVHLDQAEPVDLHQCMIENEVGKDSYYEPGIRCQCTSRYQAEVSMKDSQCALPEGNQDIDSSIDSEYWYVPIVEYQCAHHNKVITKVAPSVKHEYTHHIENSTKDCLYAHKYGKFKGKNEFIAYLFDWSMKTVNVFTVLLLFISHIYHFCSYYMMLYQSFHGCKDQMFTRLQNPPAPLRPPETVYIHFYMLYT